MRALTYPPDDDYSMMQLSSDSDANFLGIWHRDQLVQNEATNTDRGDDVMAEYAVIVHTPVRAGSLTGTVYRGDTAVQTFCVSDSGEFNFTAIGAPSIYAVTNGSSLNISTGDYRVSA
jgi:hypothetical protein